MRDKKVINEHYFELFIEEKQKLIHDSFVRIDSGVLTEDQVPFAKYQIFLFSLEMLIAKYSAGYSEDVLKNEYSSVLDLLLSGWDDSIVKFRASNRIFDQYWLNQYCYIVWMISLGELLNVSKSEKLKLKDLIIRGKINDELIVYLLEFITKSHITDDVKKTTYLPFRNLKKNGLFMEVTSSDVKNYLLGWFKNTKLLTWHNYSSSIERAKYYYGYWCFESAFFVVALNLDDSAFKSNEYYPKDLVDYYRKQNQ